MLLARYRPVSSGSCTVSISNSIVNADQAIETVTHRITIRKRNDIRSGMRFVKGARVFEIETVHDPDETGRYLVCRVREEGL